jgi:hypothetical protein
MVRSLRGGLFPLNKISHAETMARTIIFCGRDREVMQDFPPSIHDRLEL